ncbi:MAG: HNH endonuclease [Clostridiales bacterium]|nr:HNH endonuclease [Clostridiales bacterium]
MSNCIICGNPITESSVEHIIPKALGNKKFVIHAVCKQCNSLLGEKIDCGSTNNIGAKLFRQQHGIKGNSNKVPNPFERGIGENGEEIRLSADMKPSIVPRIEEDENGFHVTASSAEEAIAMADKKLKRMGQPALTEEQKQTIRSKKPTKYQPKISYETSFDLHKINLEWIKIAYETLYKQFGEDILSESSMEELRSILYEYLYEDKYNKELIKGKIAIPSNQSGVDEEFNQSKSALKQETGNDVVHIIQVISENNEITVAIFVEGMVSAVVRIKVSDSSKYESKTHIILYPSGDILD